MLRIATGMVLLLAGTVWIMQGFNVAFAPESFMTGNRFWVGGGAVAVAGGLGLTWWGVRSQRRSD